MNYLAAYGQGIRENKATDFTDNTDFNICAICVSVAKNNNEAELRVISLKEIKIIKPWIH